MSQDYPFWHTPSRLCLCKDKISWGFFPPVNADLWCFWFLLFQLHLSPCCPWISWSFSLSQSVVFLIFIGYIYWGWYSPSSNSKCYGKHLLSTNSFFFFFKKRFYLFIYFYGGEGREEERERNINTWLPLMCPLSRTWPETQAYALTGNWTRNRLVCTPVLNPLSHTSQGLSISSIQSMKELFAKAFT